MLYGWFHFVLAKHPVQWSKHEVAVWLKWCSEEYSIEPIPPDRVDMNGRPLLCYKILSFFLTVLDAVCSCLLGDILV